MKNPNTRLEIKSNFVGKARGMKGHKGKPGVKFTQSRIPACTEGYTGNKIFTIYQPCHGQKGFAGNKVAFKGFTLLTYVLSYLLNTDTIHFNRKSRNPQQKKKTPRGWDWCNISNGSLWGSSRALSDLSPTGGGGVNLAR